MTPRHALSLLVPTLVATVPSPALAGPHANTALTLSGWPSAPHADRSTNAAATGIRFRAPATADVAEVHLRWRGNPRDCAVSLQTDREGAPDVEIGRGRVAGGAGWRATVLHASVAEGGVYHLVVQCGSGRLEYVLDRERTAVEAGVWQLEDLRRRVRLRRPPASPLFALRFTDGTWWGQPYHAPQRTIRVCGSHRANVTVVPATPLAIDGGRLAIRAGGRETHSPCTILGADGRPVSGSVLLAGTPYVVSLHAPRGGHC